MAKPAKSLKVCHHHSDERPATPVWLKPQPEPQRKQLLSPTAVTMPRRRIN